MFHLFVVLCMLSYDGEVCKTLQSEYEFQTKADCLDYAGKARQQFESRGNNMLRIKEMRCEKSFEKDQARHYTPISGDNS